jgi:hypothetical protein
MDMLKKQCFTKILRPIYYSIHFIKNEMYISLFRLFLPQILTMKKLSITTFIIIFFLGACKDYSQQKDVNIKDKVTVPKTSRTLDSIAESETPSKIKVPKKEAVKSSNIQSTKTALYRLRKYENVTKFYSRIAKPATDLCMENNVPPAAILAIAGLESGWNQGYVGRITGNILSLGTRRGDTKLPPLKLPKSKLTDKILFDSLVIIKHPASELIWEKRPPSLKKDYRPKPFAGTPYNLAYFKYHPKQKTEAQIENINDFVTIFISRESRIKAYREGRHLMDSLVSVHGKEILLKESTAIKFIHEIGGKPNSFNFRETWPKKVVNIIKKAGLEELTSALYLNNAQFEDTW